MKARKIFAISLVLSTICFEAQAQLEISAEFRPRFELNYGFGHTPVITQIPTAYVSQRTRLNFSHNGPTADFYLSLQDVRIWGDDNLANHTSSLMNTASLGIHQAWAGFRLHSKHYLRIGRQEFSYDDERLLAARKWPQYGQTYDALLYRCSKNKWQIDLALSYNNDASEQGSGFGNNYFLVDPIENRIRTLNFLYLKRNLGKNAYVSGLAIFSGYQKERQSNTIYMMATLGGHFSKQKRFSDFKANYYIQRGKSQKGKNMNSYFFSAAAHWKQARLQPGIGIDLLSGNDARKNEPEYTSREHSFDLLYGLRFSRYGRLNQYVLPSSTLGGGWIDVYPSVSRQTRKYGTFTAEWHFFRLHRPVVNPLIENDILEGSLGSEIDLIWQYNLKTNLNFFAGFAWYMANNTFAYVKGIEPDKLAKPYYGWLMLTYKPVLFKSEK